MNREEYMNNKPRNENSRKGFTLIEMMVVLFVVGIGLIGALSFFNMNINSQFDAKNELIASSLAQEGADLVRNIRDYNILNPTLRPHWYSQLNDNLQNGESSDLCKSVGRVVAFGFHQCHGVDTFKYVRFSSGTGTYIMGVSTDAERTIFNRTVTAVSDGNLDSGGCLTITSTVTWDNGARETKAFDYLCNNSL
jgi:prepilin-type N-terminal cleavage/methylation domain-containing protein